MPERTVLHRIGRALRRLVSVKPAICRHGHRPVIVFVSDDGGWPSENPGTKHVECFGLDRCKGPSVPAEHRDDLNADDRAAQAWNDQRFLEALREKRNA